MELSDADLGALLAFPNLRNLDLSDSSSSETGFAQLTRLSTLRAVQLRNVSASDELIAKVLDANPQLTAVIVDNTYAAELTARSLLRLQQLEAVSVVDTSIPAPYLDTYRSQGVSVFTAWANTAEQQRALCPRKRKEEDQDLSHVPLH
jgi:hypothetical protein